MTDLTEQWKKGELPEGWYYIELNEPFDKIHKDISYYSSGSFDIEVDSNYIIEVLAPVPSFEEWQILLIDNEVLKQYQEIDFGTAYTETMKADAENQQLKELLREWVQFEIEENPNDFTVISERMSELANKTKQAIGEK